jgi:hypothetical protein
MSISTFVFLLIVHSTHPPTYPTPPNPLPFRLCVDGIMSWNPVASPFQIHRPEISAADAVPSLAMLFQPAHYTKSTGKPVSSARRLEVGATIDNKDETLDADPCGEFLPLYQKNEDSAPSSLLVPPLPRHGPGIGLFSAAVAVVCVVSPSFPFPSLLFLLPSLSLSLSLSADVTSFCYCFSSTRFIV